MATKNFRKAKRLFDELCLDPTNTTAEAVETILFEKYPVNGPRVIKNELKLFDTAQIEEPGGLE